MFVHTKITILFKYSILVFFLAQITYKFKFITIKTLMSFKKVNLDKLRSRKL